MKSLVKIFGVAVLSAGLAAGLGCRKKDEPPPEPAAVSPDTPVAPVAPVAVEEGRPSAPDKDLLPEAELWAAARKADTIEAYEAYYQAYPEGAHAKEAVRSLVRLWEDKVKELTPEDMEKLTAVIETNRGVIKFKFNPREAPGHCRNFIRLAQSHFYDGTIFHRVIQGFMIQGGDPQGTGMGGPGYTINAEFSDLPHNAGTVSMARSRDPNSAGSQFFICLERTPHLDGQYSVFGQVVEGMEVVKAIGATRVRAGNNRPVEDQVMEKVYIEGLDQVSK